MFRSQRLLALAGGTLVLSLASAVPVAAASSTTRWVDNDGHAGPGGCGGSAVASTSIQSAVTASNADDVVIVCPGTYTEQVRIRGDRDGLIPPVIDTLQRHDQGTLVGGVTAGLHVPGAGRPCRRRGHHGLQGGHPHRGALRDPRGCHRGHRLPAHLDPRQPPPRSRLGRQRGLQPEHRRRGR